MGVLVHLAVLVSVASTGSAPGLQRSSLLDRSRVLRGGSTASTTQLPAAAPEKSPTLQATAAEGNATESTTIGLDSGSFRALRLQSGDRVHVRKLKRHALWSNVPDQALGEATEEPALPAGALRMSAASMKTIKLHAGDGVTVTPIPTAATAAAPTGGAVPADSPSERVAPAHRRSNPMMRMLWWQMMMSPRGGYYHGYGGRPSYTRQRYSYGYSGGRRRASYGRMGGRRR